MNGPVQRTQYQNLGTGTIRTGATGHGESLVDVEGYLMPLDRAQGAALFTWGVADGLAVRAVAGANGVTVLPGTALDALGRLVLLATDGVAVVDQDVDAGQVQNVPTVPVPAAGVALPTPATAGDVVLTITWREVQSSSVLSSAPSLLHAPWLRLLPAGAFTDVGDQVVLARLTLDATGAVGALAPGSRRLAGVPAGRVELRRTAPSDQGLTVGQVAAAELTADAAGDVALTLLSAGPPRTAFRVDAATAGVAVTGPLTVSRLEAAGPLVVAADTTVTGSLTVSRIASAGPLDVGADLRVAGALAVSAEARFSGPLTAEEGVTLTGPAGRVWTMTSGADAAWRLRDASAGADRVLVDPAGNLVIGAAAGQRTLHVEGHEVHSGGGAGGFSFADRSNGAFVDTPGSGGERWVWYALGGTARLWSGVDRLSISPTGEGGALDVPRRMRMRQGGDGSAGFWLFQDEADQDMAFIGMRDDFHVGFWGNTGVGWGVVMNTSDGTVDVVGNLNVGGRISKHGGGFTIDHPLEPDKKLLSHSFVESPDMLNLYTGTVVTDHDGCAVVALPDYFEALNSDARVQLTPVGEPVATAVGEDGIRDNAFTIRSARPGVPVAWLVTGIRQDTWARENRIRVEEHKEEAGR